jgi:hypothetical protein
MKSDDFEMVFGTMDPAEVVVVKSLLDSVGIRYMTRGEDRFDAFPGAFRGTVFSDRARPVRFLVSKDDASDARQLLRSTDS